MELGELLSTFRRQSGMTIEELSTASGVPKGTINKIIAGTTKAPTLDTMKALARALGKRLADFDDIQNAPSGLSKEAKQLAQDYDEHLDVWGQKAVRGLADTEMARTAAERTAQQAPTPAPTEKPAQAITALPKAKRRSDGFAEIKAYEQPAAAGLGNYLDEPPYRMEQYPEEIVPEKTDFGVIISGNSMEPEIHDGATVFVQSCPTLEAGEVGIFVLDGKAYCKMLFVDHDKRQVRLVSINKAYDDIVVGENDDMYTLGRVLGQYVPRIL